MMILVGTIWKKSMHIHLKLKMLLCARKSFLVHAITLALQSTLKYGDELLYITGSPYDTLLEVIG